MGNLEALSVDVIDTHNCSVAVASLYNDGEEIWRWSEFKWCEISVVKHENGHCFVTVRKSCRII